MEASKYLQKLIREYNHGGNHYAFEVYDEDEADYEDEDGRLYQYLTPAQAKFTYSTCMTIRELESIYGEICDHICVLESTLSMVRFAKSNQKGKSKIGKVSKSGKITEEVQLVSDNTSYAYAPKDRDECLKVLRSIRTPYNTKSRVGNMTNIVLNSKAKTIDEFRKEYLSKYGDMFRENQQKYLELIKKKHLDRRYFTDTFIKEYFERFVINNSFVGIKNQDIICKYLAKKYNKTYRVATSDEDTAGIDAYIGDKPVQIKGKKWGVPGDDSMYVYYDTKNNTITYKLAYFEE